MNHRDKSFFACARGCVLFLVGATGVSCSKPTTNDVGPIASASSSPLASGPSITEPYAKMSPDDRANAIKSACTSDNCERKTLAAIIHSAPGSGEQDQLVIAADAQEKSVALANAASDPELLAKIVPQRSFADTAGSTVRINDVTTARTWTFGFQQLGYSTIEADKGTTFVIVSFDVVSSAKNPQLSCALGYLLDPETKQLRKAGVFDYQFRRWDDYGSSLGNYSDRGNDFAKSDTVKFSGGLQIAQADLATKSLFIVFAKTPTRERHTTSVRPPIKYTGECDGPLVLSAKAANDDFVVVEIRKPHS